MDSLSSQQSGNVNESSKLSSVHTMHPSDGKPPREKNVLRKIIIGLIVILVLGFVALVLVQYVRNSEVGKGGTSEAPEIAPGELLEKMNRYEAEYGGQEPLSDEERAIFFESVRSDYITSESNHSGVSTEVSESENEEIAKQRKEIFDLYNKYEPSQ